MSLNMLVILINNRCWSGLGSWIMERFPRCVIVCMLHHLLVKHWKELRVKRDSFHFNHLWNKYGSTLLGFLTSEYSAGKKAAQILRYITSSVFTEKQNKNCVKLFTKLFEILRFLYLKCTNWHNRKPLDESEFIVSDLDIKHGQDIAKVRKHKTPSG